MRAPQRSTDEFRNKIEAILTGYELSQYFECKGPDRDRTFIEFWAEWDAKSYGHESTRVSSTTMAKLAHLLGVEVIVSGGDLYPEDPAWSGNALYFLAYDVNFGASKTKRSKRVKRG